jgi:hypothetical protein
VTTPTANRLGGLAGVPRSLDGNDRQTRTNPTINSICDRDHSRRQCLRQAKLAPQRAGIRRSYRSKSESVPLYNEEKPGLQLVADS